MKCIPCHVTVDGVRFEISKDGLVRGTQIVEGQSRYYWLVDDAMAKRVRKDAARQRTNRNRRERDEAMRLLGLVKTPYGWE